MGSGTSCCSCQQRHASFSRRSLEMAKKQKTCATQHPSAHEADCRHVHEVQLLGCRVEKKLLGAVELCKEAFDKPLSTGVVALACAGDTRSVTMEQQPVSGPSCTLHHLPHDSTETSSDTSTRGRPSNSNSKGYANNAHEPPWWPPAMNGSVLLAPVGVAPTSNIHVNQCPGRQVWTKAPVRRKDKQLLCHGIEEKPCCVALAAWKETKNTLHHTTPHHTHCVPEVSE